MKSNTCVHFTGIQNVQCKLGIRYKSVADPHPGVLRLPCLNDPELPTTAVCPSCRFPTDTELAAWEQETERHIQELRALKARLPKSKQFVWFECHKCTGDYPTFDHIDTFIEHLMKVHQMQRPIAGTKSMVLHTDATNWHETTYRWHVDGAVIALQVVRVARK